LLASVFPDIDLIYFYRVDHSQDHHAYLPHLPLAWLAAFATGAAVLRLTRASRCTGSGWAWSRSTSTCISSSTRLQAESVGSGRFSERELVLTYVAARYRPWYLNFVLHWTFALEPLTVLAAAIMLMQRRSAG
jgi:inner membrane protein